jgi:hypothetical protein
MGRGAYSIKRKWWQLTIFNLTNYRLYDRIRVGQINQPIYSKMRSLGGEMNWKTVVFYLISAVVLVVAAELFSAFGVETKLFPGILLTASGLVFATALIQIFDSLKRRGGTHAVFGSILAILFLLIWAGLFTYAKWNQEAVKNPFNIGVILMYLALLVMLGFEIRTLVKTLRKR